MKKREFYNLLSWWGLLFSSWKKQQYDLFLTRQYCHFRHFPFFFHQFNSSNQKKFEILRFLDHRGSWNCKKTRFLAFFGVFPVFFSCLAKTTFLKDAHVSWSDVVTLSFSANPGRNAIATSLPWKPFSFFKFCLLLPGLCWHFFFHPKQVSAEILITRADSKKSTFSSQTKWWRQFFSLLNALVSHANALVRHTNAHRQSPTKWEHFPRSSSCIQNKCWRKPSWGE